MNEVKDSYKLYKCETCGNQISGITKMQQGKPSSLIWSRYGLCSPGCLAPESTRLKKEDLIVKNVPVPDNGNNSISHLNRFENQPDKISPGYVTDHKINIKKKHPWQKFIASGKLIGGLAFLTGLFFYYTEFIEGALICLGFGIIGIVLCRIGVWKKCRVR
jgi:hypothetical protein